MIMLGVHGNLKPSSIRFDGERVVLTDPCRLVGALPANEIDAMFVAPECRGESEAERPENDVWSLGLLLGWVCASGPANPSITLTQQGVEVSPELDALFLDATQPDPDARISTVAEFMTRMETALSESSITQKTPDVEADTTLAQVSEESKRAILLDVEPTIADMAPVAIGSAVPESTEEDIEAPSDPEPLDAGIEAESNADT